MNTPRRLHRLTSTAVAVALAATVGTAAPADAETGLNGMPRETWLPLTVDGDAPLPRDHALWTDDCRYDSRLPRAFDADAVRTSGTAPVVTVPRPGPGGPGMESCGTVTATGVRMPDRLSLGSYLVYDVDTGDVLAAKDPYGLYRPASVIKILLVMTSLDELDPDRAVPVTPEMANVDGSKVGVGPGGRYTVTQLLQGVVMNSGNDAALALAGALGGTQATVAKMQARAESLGTVATRVTTVNGLDTPETQTTAYDLSLIYREAFRRADVRALLGTRQASFPGFGGNPGFEISSDNGLLYDYPGTVGGKTGFTDNARHTYAAAVTRRGRTLGIVALNSTIAAGRPWVQAESVFDAVFAAPQAASVGGLTDAPVDGTSAASGPDSAGVTDVADDSGHPRRAGTVGSLPVVLVGAFVGIGVLLVGVRWFTRRRLTSDGRSPRARH